MMFSAFAPFRIVVLVILGIVVCRPAVAETRIALVLGIGAYPSAPLSSPEKDAQAVAAKLKGLGFAVTEKLDLKRDQLLGVIREFGERLSQQRDSIGLFYYSGHGVSVNGRNYIIPVDADGNISSEADVEVEAVPVENVLMRMTTTAQDKVNIIILDACRDNPFEKRWKSLSGGLSEEPPPGGTLIAYAAAAGHVAEAGQQGSLSKYTEALVRLMDEPRVDLIRMFQDVQKAVFKSTDGHQYPYLEISPGVPDDIFLKVRPSPSGELTVSQLFAQARAAASRNDDAEAVRLYKIAVDQGSSDAAANLGFFYERGRGGLPKNDAEAARLYKLSADQGNAGGQANLGFFYENGRGGLPKDDKEAARLYKLSADQGNEFGQANLGAFYVNGRGGLPKDTVEAVRLFRLSANQGNTSAQANLGGLYANGQGGLPKDDKEAARLCKLSADQGNAEGQANLGVLYENGRGGLPKNDAEAARLFKLSADQGNAGGQANLGGFYESGRGGLPKDEKEAARLYKLSADQGNMWAKAALNRLVTLERN